MDLVPLAGYPLGIGVLLTVLGLLFAGRLLLVREAEYRDRYITKLEERCERLTSLTERLTQQLQEQQAMFERSLSLIERQGSPSLRRTGR